MKSIFVTILLGALVSAAEAQNTPWSTSTNIGIGTTSPAAPLEILSTGENLRLSYDAANRTTFNTGSSGNLVIVPGAGGTSNSVTITGSLITGTTSSNLWVPSTSAAGATTAPQYLYGSGTATYVKTGVYGSSTTSTTTGRTIATFMVAGSPYTVAASAVLPWAATSVFKPLGAITLGSGSSVTNTAVVYIDGASSQGDKNYALFSNSGMNYFGGNVGIGVVNSTEKLAVNGTIHAKEVKIDLIGWPDYVFENNYKLMPIHDVAVYLQKNKHLPGIPSQKDIESDGLQVGEINKQLTKKIEELTLYLIDQNKQIKRLEQAIKARKKSKKS